MKNKLKFNIVSDNQNTFNAAISLLLAAGYDYHGKTTLEEIDKEFPFTTYPSNSVDLIDKDIAGNYTPLGGLFTYNLPQDFVAFINKVNGVGQPKIIAIENVGDYKAHVDKDGIYIYGEVISFEKFAEIEEAVNKLRDDA